MNNNPNYHPDPHANNKRAPIIEVDASAIKNEDGTPVDLTNTPQLVKWLRTKYQGKEITIKDDGSKVKFTTAGLKDSAKRKGKEQRQVYAGLDVLLENAIYDGYEDGDARHPYIEKQNIYYAAARIGSDNYSIKFKIDVFKKTGDMSYKDHKVAAIEIAPAMNTDAVPNLSLYEGRIGALQNESAKMTTIKEAFSADKGTQNKLNRQTLQAREDYTCRELEAAKLACVWSNRCIRMQTNLHTHGNKIAYACSFS